MCKGQLYAAVFALVFPGPKSGTWGTRHPAEKVPKICTLEYLKLATCDRLPINQEPKRKSWLIGRAPETLDARHDVVLQTHGGSNFHKDHGGLNVHKE